MTSSSEGKKFTIPSIEDVKKYELAQTNNGPLLFNKHKESSEKSNERVKLDHVVSTATTNVEVSTTTSTPTVTSTSTYCITASPVQRQNPVVRFIRNIPITFDDIIPDFVLGKTTCALFLR